MAEDGAGPAADGRDAGKGPSTDAPKDAPKDEVETERKERKASAEATPAKPADEPAGKATDDEKAKKIAEAKKKAAAKKAAAKKEQPWPFAPTYQDPKRTEDLDPLKERFGDRILKTGDMSGKPVAYVAPEVAWAVLKFAHEELDFDHLPFVSAADYPKEEILEVHWQLYSYPRDGRGGKDLAIKTHVPREEAHVPSVVSLWTGAEWHEREAFDMFGVRFQGHKDLRRLFMPDGWHGYPLLKDYDRKEQYIGLSETGEDVVYDTPGPYRW